MTFAQHLQKQRGQPAGLFSFNSLGACPVCKGKGVLTPEVAFADPVTIPCEACGGTRYSDEALSYRYQDKNIIEILQLTIDEAADYFKQQKILNRVNTLKDVGLGYLTLGQTTSSLSGGEIQRLKLASQLQKEGQIYLLDEPSLGLHAEDDEKLLDVFQKLVNRGNSVISNRTQFRLYSGERLDNRNGSGRRKTRRWANYIRRHTRRNAKRRDSDCEMVKGWSKKRYIGRNYKNSQGIRREVLI